MKYALYVAACILLLGACKSKSGLLHQYANTHALPMQQFTINTAADTTLTGSQGIKVLIAKGTFTGAATVTVLLKEALDYASILKGGLLTTTTDGKALSSGGMFYLGTKENATISKPIQVSVPTKFADPAMQLYKGKEGEEGIGWEEPRAIEMDTMAYAWGRKLFNANCTSCHAINRKLTGPPLAGITHRKSRKWIYNLVRNPAGFMAQDVYLQNLKRQYGGAMMTAFPALGTKGVDCILNYIEMETTKQREVPDRQPVTDSCCYYKYLYNDLLSQRDWLTVQDGFSDKWEGDTADIGVFAYQPGIDTTFVDDTVKTQRDSAGFVEEADYSSSYYKVSIEAEGWYNIDCLLKIDEGILKPSLLSVRLQGSYTERMEVYLAIPSYKIFLTGQVLDDGKLIGFGEKNSQLPLPQNESALVFVTGEKEGDLFFSKLWITTQLTQSINITPVKMTKQAFEKELAQLGLGDIKTEVLENKNLESVKGIDSLMDKMKTMRLEDCNCADWPEKVTQIKQ